MHGEPFSSFSTVDCWCSNCLMHFQERRKLCIRISQLSWGETCGSSSRTSTKSDTWKALPKGKIPKLFKYSAPFMLLLLCRLLMFILFHDNSFWLACLHGIFMHVWGGWTEATFITITTMAFLLSCVAYPHRCSWSSFVVSFCVIKLQRRMFH